jgi:hypothetical protein
MEAVREVSAGRVPSTPSREREGLHKCGPRCRVCSRGKLVGHAIIRNVGRPMCEFVRAMIFSLWATYAAYPAIYFEGMQHCESLKACQSMSQLKGLILMTTMLHSHAVGENTHSLRCLREAKHSISLSPIAPLKHRVNERKLPSACRFSRKLRRTK